MAASALDAVYRVSARDQSGITRRPLLRRERLDVAAALSCRGRGRRLGRRSRWNRRHCSPVSSRLKSSWAAATARSSRNMRNCIPSGIFWPWNGSSAGCGKSTAKGCAPAWPICVWCASRLLTCSNIYYRANRFAPCTFIFPTPGRSGGIAKTDWSTPASRSWRAGSWRPAAWFICGPMTKITSRR